MLCLVEIGDEEVVDESIFHLGLSEQLLVEVEVQAFQVASLQEN